MEQTNEEKGMEPEANHAPRLSSSNGRLGMAQDLARTGAELQLWPLVKEASKLYAHRYPFKEQQE